MSAAARKARKARKRAGVKFVHPVKVGTPLVERSWFKDPVPGALGTRSQGKWSPRSLAKRNRALKARGLEEIE